MKYSLKSPNRLLDGCMTCHPCRINTKAPILLHLAFFPISCQLFHEANTKAGLGQGDKNDSSKYKGWN